MTPELYLGYARGQFGNPMGIEQDRAYTYYDDPGRHMEGLAYIVGNWTVNSESARAESTGAAIVLRYTAMEVNLVMAPPANRSGRIELSLSEGQHPGSDVVVEHGRMFITVERPRMYSLISNESVIAGGLKLTCHDAGVNAFAFTFISCPVN